MHKTFASELVTRTKIDSPYSDHSAKQPVRGKALLLRALAIAAMIILFLWPAIWNRAPFYFLDTRTYIRSIDAAMNKLTHTHTNWTAEDDASAEPQNSSSSVTEERLYDLGQAKTRSLGEITKKGIMLGRSLYWGLLLYVGSVTGGFWLTIVLQSACIPFAIYLTLRSLAYPVWPTLAYISLGLALFSDAAFYSSFLLPDLFLGFAVLGCAVLIALRRKLEHKEATAWYLFLLGALLCHDSCILVAGSLLLVAVSANFFRRSWSNWRGLCIIILALMTAYAAESLVNYGITRATHQAPLRFPLLEARLIADGPGTQYLRATCPQSHFALCAHVRDFPMTSEDFLFGTDPGKSVYEVASYEQRKALSAEQIRFVLAVLRYDPVGVVRSGLQNAWTQFSNFTLSNFNSDATFNDKMERTFPESVMVQIRRSSAYHETFPVATFSALLYIFVIGSFIYLLLVRLGVLSERSMNDLLTSMFIWSFAGLVLNAALSGGISFPQSRYQARVVWIIPLIALLVESQRWVHRREAGSCIVKTMIESEPARHLA